VSFDYHEPASVEDAVSMLSEYGESGIALAGGTAVTVLRELGLIWPRHVVGLRRLVDLRRLATDGDGLWLGALVTAREVERSPLVRGGWPAIAAAFGSIGTIRIRNQGTVGGNLAHADPAQDPPPMLIASDAVVLVAGPRGNQREVPLEEFFVGYLATVLEPGDVVLGVRVPEMVAGTRATYAKFVPGSVDDYATVSVAAALRLGDDGRVAAARVALGSVAATPVRARAVEAAVTGERPHAGVLRDAAELVRDEIEPIGDRRGTARYKREMARVWTARALTAVASVST
jgi:carbon-monoxide dehydrogenase medium subunit